MSAPPPSTSPTLPSPPFIAVTGIPNFRDLGGYPISSSPSYSIRRGVIFRCAEPSAVTKDGIAAMQQLGITHCYDLRSYNEIERNRAAGRGGSVEWDGCRRVFAPVFEDEDYSPEALAVRFKDYSTGGPEGFTRAYSAILTGAPKSYKKILLHIAHEPEKPLIVHCTAGKDRTGVLCALVLSICGVGDEVIAQEYQLTESGLTREWKEGVMKHLQSLDKNLVGNLEGARNMVSAKAEYMIATLKMIKEQFGSAEGYVIEKCGLTKEEVEKIRKNLVVDEPAIHEKSQHTLQISNLWKKED